MTTAGNPGPPTRPRSGSRASFRYPRHVRLVLLLVFTVAGCGRDQATPAAPAGVLITTASVQTEDLELTEASVGRIESTAAPLVAAEIAGRVNAVKVEVGHEVVAGEVLATLDPEDYRLRVSAAQADAARLQAQVEQQQRLVTRYAELAQKDFFARNSLEEAQAQLKVLTRQLDAVRAGGAGAQRDLGRAIVRAPIAGRIEERLVDAGDYVQPGTGMFRVSTDQALRAVLPYPEHLGDRLAAGQAVYLSPPLGGTAPLRATITELRPTIGTGNRAIEVLVDFINPGTWRAGSSVDGFVVVGQHRAAVTVPEGAVILRPAGATVYVVDGGKVQARVVRTGARVRDRIEILEGLASGLTVAVDGAGFLTDGAAVRVKEAGA